MTLTNMEQQVDHLAAFNAMERGVIFLDLEGRVLYMNSCAASRSTDKASESIGRPIWDGLDWRNIREERESLIRHFRQAVQMGMAQQMILKQGRRFSSPERSIIHITLTPVPDGQGGVAQVVMEEWHVPVSIQMEIKLRMTESVFRSFLDQSPLPAWLVDAQGKLIAMSRTYADLLGLTVDDIGKDMMQLIPSRFVLQYTKHHEKILNSGDHLHVVENWMGPDGLVRTYIVHKFPIRTGRLITMIGAISFEVTEKLRMEEEFKETHERFSLASEATQDLIWDWDINADAVRTQGNPEVMWTDKGQQVYSSSVFFSKMHPDDRDRMATLVGNALADPAVTTVQGAYRFHTQDGRYAHILDRAQILRDEHGRAYRVVGSAMRLTETLRRALQSISSSVNTDTGESRIAIRDLKWTGGEHLEYSIRRLLEKTDPAGTIHAGLSIIGMDQLIRSGFDTGNLMAVIGRFFDMVRQTGMIRNLSLYIWFATGKVHLRMSHDGDGLWEKQLKDWVGQSGMDCTWEYGRAGDGQAVVSFMPAGFEQHDQHPE